MKHINQLSHQIFTDIGWSSQFVEEISSTSDWAHKDFPDRVAKKAIYLAENQTAGRGRGHRSWSHSPEGACLMATFCYRISEAPQPITTPRVGLALWQALKQTWPQLDLQLRAPNDIFLSGQKLAGLLVEVHSGVESFLYVGLGLNVSSSPQVDQPTTFLESSVNITSDVWKSFLVLLISKLEVFVLSQLFKKGLDEGEVKELIDAMGGIHQEQAIVTIEPSGAIVTDQGKISWLNL